MQGEPNRVEKRSIVPAPAENRSVPMEAPPLAPTPAPRRTVAGEGSPLRILLVEDSPEYALLMGELLQGAAPAGELEILHRTTLSEAELELRRGGLSCVLLDLGLPDTAGLDGLARIQEVAPALPVVVLSGEQSEDVAVQAVHQGAQDYLVKRGATGELVLRSIRYAMERKRNQVALAHQALHDSLTGLPNRTLLIDRMAVALARSERGRHRVALLFLDLDRFKLVNDSFGHDAGDRLLCAVAQRLSGLLRPSDTVARFGGDEFMLLCD
jgi:PleD family two-component response regulator